MAEVKVPRFMISAPGSGSGKTTIVCGLLKALMENCLLYTSPSPRDTR